MIANVAAQKSRRLRGGIILSRICNRLGWARDRLMRADFTCGFTAISRGGPFDPLAGTSNRVVDLLDSRAAHALSLTVV